MLRKRVIGGVAAMAGNRAVIMLVQLALIPVLANSWDIGTYGVWVMATTIPALLTFADFGFATAMGTAMAMQLEQDDRAAAAATFGNAFGVINVIGVVLAVVAALTAWAVPADWLASTGRLPIGDLRLIIALFAVYSACALQGTIGFSALRAAGRTSLAVNLQSAAYAAENIAIAAIALAGGSPLEAAAALAVSRAIFVIAQAVLLARREPWLGRGLLWNDWAGVKQLARPAHAAMVISIAQAVLLQGTALALGASASAAVVPTFTAVRTLSRTGVQLTAIVSTTVMPEFSRATAANNTRMLAKFLALTLISAAVLVVPLAIALGLFGREIVLIWTKGAIAPTETFIAIMALGTLFGGTWTPVSNLLVARQMQGRFAYSLLLLSVAAIPATYLLAPAWGATAAAASSMVLDAVMFVLIFRLVRELPVGLHDLRLATAELKHQVLEMLGGPRSSR